MPTTGPAIMAQAFMALEPYPIMADFFSSGTLLIISAFRIPEKPTPIPSNVRNTRIMIQLISKKNGATPPTRIKMVPKTAQNR